MNKTEPQEELQERDPWDRMDGEPLYWYSLFNQFRLMGPSRKLRTFYRKKRAESGMSDLKPEWGTPTNWVHYARDWKWKERAEAWDAEMREQQEGEAEDTLTNGIAMSYKRIERLIALADKLEEIIFHGNRAPSPYMVEQYRGILDDIAKEKGERSKEVRLTGSKSGPIQIETSWGRGGSASDAWERKQIAAPTDAIEGVIVTEALSEPSSEDTSLKDRQAQDGERGEDQGERGNDLPF